LRPEAELLLCAARVHLDAPGVVRMRAILEQPIDWRDLLALATAQGVLPLLYWHLTKGFWDAVPESIFQELHHVFHRHALNNLYLTGELLKALDLCKAHGIAALPFKGLTLAACAYGNLALRDLVDLDLFLRARDLAKAAELLLSQGYQPMFKLSRAQEAAYLASLGQCSLVSSHSAGVVDLHRALLPRDFFFPLNFERVWERRVTLSLGGMEVPTLCPEDLLLFLCVHGAKHHWTYLKWICDIAHLIHRHPEMNWTFVREEAHRLASQRMLFLGLLVAKKLLQARLPEEVWQRIKTDATVESLAAQVTRNLFSSPNRKAGGFASALFHLRTRERLRDGVRYSLSFALVPTLADYDLVPLPRLLYFLYYVLRPMRLAGRYGQNLFSFFSVGNGSR
jgi:hypothetical protein